MKFRSTKEVISAPDRGLREFGGGHDDVVEEVERHYDGEVSEE